MSESDDTSTIKDLLGGLFWGALITGLGIWMLVDPDLGQTSEPEGRRRGLVKLLYAIWSTPGGIIIGLIGLLIIWGAISQMRSNRNK